MTTAHDDQVVEVLREPTYGFDDKGPAYTPSHAGSWTRTVYVDPAPCYGHDEALVRTLFARLRELAPLPIPLKVCLLGHEPTERTNGWYSDEGKWEKDAEGVHRKAPVGLICLAGKRIPPHPAMTRYLMGHEYGHGVFYHLARTRGFDSDSEPLRKLYQALRPETSSRYGCGQWHQNTGEVFANDFRILHMRLETEFWPHDGVPRPEKVQAVIDFWRRVPEELGWVAASALASPSEGAS